MTDQPLPPPHAQEVTTMPPETVVEFRNVGPGHKSWTARWPGPLTHRAMVQSIKRQGALGSREIDFIFDDDGINGRIYVGVLRRVGEFTVRAEVDPTQSGAVGVARS